MSFFFLVAIAYFVAYRSIFLMREKQDSIVTLTKPGYLLSSSKNDSFSIQDALSPFQVAFTIKYFNTSNVDIVEASYGTWQVLQTVRKFNATSNTSYVEDKRVGIHSCSYSELSRLNQSMSDSYRIFFKSLNTAQLLCINQNELEPYDALDPQFSNYPPALRLSFTMCDPRSSMIC